MDDDDAKILLWFHHLVNWLNEFQVCFLLSINDESLTYSITLIFYLLLQSSIYIQIQKNKTKHKLSSLMWRTETKNANDNIFFLLFCFCCFFYVIQSIHSFIHSSIILVKKKHKDEFSSSSLSCCCRCCCCFNGILLFFFRL
mgnify:CR=1 FL=1